MPMVTNTAPRPIHIGGVLLRPGQPAEVPADALKNKVVEALVQDKTLTMSELPPEQAAQQVEQKAQETAGTNAATPAASAPKPAPASAPAKA